MSWSSIVSKKKNNKAIKKVIQNKENNINNEYKVDEKMKCKENFENKYDLDLYDLCFDLKSYLDENSDLLINIDSFKIGNFIKEYIDYSKYCDQEEHSESDNEFENL